MADDQPKGEPTPENIRDDMQTTRAHLGAGVQALGDKAMGYAQDAADAVEGACRSTMDALHGLQHAVADGASVARHAVTDATDAVGRAFDVRHHIRQRPWLAVAVAVAAGVACGRFLARR
ncbi:DUF3618 domain-containing protein [Limnoglobus roseus]|uniref:DUF883 domain-containing protein n=1 Tax=Limnoglobus roseus TaxID=2598579 RepID=A0A5C1AMR5_9BACT|nr:DUF3618 domain-containing protein [Limnoglobus roseus]QEL20531.1 hypothetical protein PX52LOC_07636 [Limnoglobus roseus]